MPSFSFTEKKFLSLKKETRRKWVISWLTDIYQNFITNRISPDSIASFVSDYGRIVKWMGIPPEDFPQSKNNRDWVEFISDAIHLHRIAAGISPKDHDLLAKPLTTVTKDDLPNQKTEALDYHVALDCFRSLFNVGAIFRICDAAGFKSIILGNTPGPEHNSVQKTSMGASGWVKAEKTNDLISTLIKKKEKGYSIIGIETIEGSENYTDFKWPEKAILVIGNEEYGISRHVLRICDYFVHIPMFGRKNSINVANASSVIMFHIAQRLKP